MIDVYWNVARGMLCWIDTWIIRPLMNDRMAVPRMGRHSDSSAPFSTGAEHSSSMGLRMSRHRLQNATDTKNNTAPAGAIVDVGKSVTNR